MIWNKIVGLRTTKESELIKHKRENMNDIVQQSFIVVDDNPYDVNLDHLEGNVSNIETISAHN